MELSRGLGGIDLKTAAPNLYRLTDEFRKRVGAPDRPEFSGDTTPQSRARTELYQAILENDAQRFSKAYDAAKSLNIKLSEYADLEEIIKDRDPLQGPLEVATQGAKRKLGIERWESLSRAEKESAKMYIFRTQFMQKLAPEEKKQVQRIYREHGGLVKRIRPLVRSAAKIRQEAKAKAK